MFHFKNDLFNDYTYSRFLLLRKSITSRKYSICDTFRGSNYAYPYLITCIAVTHFRRYVISRQIF